MEGFKKNNININRRNFLTGLLATAAVSPAAAEQMRPVSREDAAEARRRIEERINSIIEELPDTWQSFIERQLLFTSHYERELDSVLSFGSQITNNDPNGRTRLVYLQNALQLSESFSATESDLLRRFLLAKAVVESGLDADRTSGIAFGILQFTDISWNEHRPHEHANSRSLVDQVAATASLLEQMRRELTINIGEILDDVKRDFFNNDADLFHEHFFVPVLLNSFNAGARSLRLIIEEFHRLILSSDKINVIISSGIDIDLSKKDLFGLMTYFAKELKWGVDYGEQAYNYVPRIYAARLVLDTHVPASLLGNENST